MKKAGKGGDAAQALFDQVANEDAGLASSDDDDEDGGPGLTFRAEDFEEMAPNKA